MQICNTYPIQQAINEMLTAGLRWKYEMTYNRANSVVVYENMVQCEWPVIFQCRKMTQFHVEML